MSRARACAGLCAVVALVAPGATPRALGQTGVPIAKLTLAERLRTAPGTTVVQLGPRTTTLAALRAAHRAREAALARAGAAGARLYDNGVAGRGPVRVGGTTIGPQPFIEPQSQYASAPADMRAFCAAARASACLFLPPGQQMTLTSPSIASDWDSLITLPQCAAEGGTWQGTWNAPAYFCAFAYPASVTVHFTPAANFKLSQSATCDTSIFGYNVDTHGAVFIQIKGRPPMPIATDSGSFCAVIVTPGG